MLFQHFSYFEDSPDIFPLRTNFPVVSQFSWFIEPMVNKDIPEGKIISSSVGAVVAFSVGNVVGLRTAVDTSLTTTVVAADSVGQVPCSLSKVSKVQH